MRPHRGQARRTAGIGAVLVALLAWGVAQWLGPADDPGPHRGAPSASVDTSAAASQSATPRAATGSAPGATAPTHGPSSRPGTVASTHPTHRLSGRITRVMDGDTVRLQPPSGNARTIRLASIDAPETGGQDRPGQPYGQAARQALTRMVDGVSLSADCYDVDPHGRDVCDLVLPSGGTANRALVQAGLAWANRERGGEFLRDPAMAGLEAQARQARLGLWQDAQATAPWQWRYTCWRQGRCNGS